MELLFRVSFCLLTFLGKTLAGVIRIKEGRDVTLNCSQPGMDLRNKAFDWKKDGQEVFFYENGKHYNNGKGGQHDNFKDRVEFFEAKLQSGNASILIKNAKLTDSGNYSCGFPHPVFQSHTLIVGAYANPSITVIKQAQGWALLECKVLDAYPEPSVVWCDEAEKVLKVSDKKNDSGKDGHYNIILYTNVTKTDYYTCKATQTTLRHQCNKTTHIYIAGSNSRPEGKKTITFLLLLLLVVVDLLLP